MKASALAIAVFCVLAVHHASQAQENPIPPYKEFWFEQEVDHLNTMSNPMKTFKQRYFIADTSVYWLRVAELK